MVFDPAAAPLERAAFLAWYDKQTEWTESHGYNDPQVTAATLRSWFVDMMRDYPPMNGPLASDDVDNPRLTDYSIGREVIYAAFAWSEAEQAYKRVFGAAQTHRVGFFDVSAEDGDVWVPNTAGKLERVPR